VLLLAVMAGLGGCAGERRGDDNGVPRDYSFTPPSGLAPQGAVEARLLGQVVSNNGTWEYQAFATPLILQPGATLEVFEISVARVQIEYPDPGQNPPRDFFVLFGPSTNPIYAESVEVRVREDGFGLGLRRGWVYVTGTRPLIRTKHITCSSRGTKWVIEGRAFGERTYLLSRDGLTGDPVLSLDPQPVGVLDRDLNTEMNYRYLQCSHFSFPPGWSPDAEVIIPIDPGPGMTEEEALLEFIKHKAGLAGLHVW
jgi:hypothetical protein